MSQERRTAVRHARRMKIPCTVQRVVEEGPWDVTVLMVSAAAVRRVATQPVRVGMHIAVDLPDEAGACSGRLLRVTLVKPHLPANDLLLDGLFFKELTPREVELARAKLTAPPRAVAVSKPASAGWRTPCRLVRVRHEGPWLITMLDVSQSGIGLLTDRPLESGTFLQIELPSIRRKHLKPRLVRVTHSKPQPGGEWAVGGLFLRELTEEELQVLL
jgi:hypothetical protein